MTACSVWLANGQYISVQGTGSEIAPTFSHSSGYSPIGDLVDRSTRKVINSPSADLHELLMGCALCNNATIVAPNNKEKRWTVATLEYFSYILDPWRSNGSLIESIVYEVRNGS